MNGIRISGNQTNGFTPISNSFIDHYMPEANGSYIKVYLFLLRRFYTGNADFTVSDIADQLEYTESDIHRALSYWQKKKLLNVRKDENQQITQITFTDPDDDDTKALFGNASKETAATYLHVPDQDVPEKDLPERTNYTPEHISILTSDEDLRLLLDVLEQYLKGPLSPQNIQLVLYLYESVGFSSDLILYLYEYCLSRDKAASSYIESVALAWAKQGVDTVEKAKASTLSYNGTYSSIMKALGLNRLPAEVEKKYIDAWLSYGFDLPIIVEACSRAILHTQKPDFKYANGILENWNKQGVKTTDDVAKKDEEFKRKKTTIKPMRVTNSSSTKKPSGQFQNFTQRQYSLEEYSSLEQRLLKKH